MSDAPHPDPGALRKVLDDLAAFMDAGDALDPHAVVQTDPATGHRTIIGPFPDRKAAQSAINLLEARWAADNEPPMGLFEALPCYPPDRGLLDGLRDDATVLP